MLPWYTALAGRLDEHMIDSELLRGNPLGDPARRPLWVYVPPGYDDAQRRYPSVYVLQGYTGHLTMWRNRSPYRQPFPETADTVFAAGDVPPAVVVFVDAWTAYGGSQFVDSPGTGCYHSYLCDEVVPFVDAHYRTLPDRAHRAISGKSSGGFGAMITPMLRPDLFGALASHAGDALYELCYLAQFGKSVRHLRDYDGDISASWADFQSRTAFTKPADGDLLEMVGISACFSAREDGTPELPFDPHTGVLRAEIWQRWLDWDPVRMAPRHAEALRSLRAVWLDAGTRDEWYLDVGAGGQPPRLVVIARALGGEPVLDGQPPGEVPRWHAFAVQDLGGDLGGGQPDHPVLLPAPQGGVLPGLGQGAHDEGLAGPRGADQRLHTRAGGQHAPDRCRLIRPELDPRLAQDGDESIHGPGRQRRGTTPRDRCSQDAFSVNVLGRGEQLFTWGLVGGVPIRQSPRRREDVVAGLGDLQRLHQRHALCGQAVQQYGHLPPIEPTQVIR